MPARCFPKYALLSKTRPVQNFAMLNSLKSYYNKIPPKLLIDFVPRLLSRTAESLRRRVRVWRRKKGGSFTSSGNERKKLSVDRDRRAGKSDGPRKIPRRYYAPTYRPRRIMVTSCRDFQLPSKWKLSKILRNESAASSDSFAIMPAQLIIAVELN